MDVQLTSLVGVYSRIGILPDIHAVLFTAVPTGGTLQTQPGETIDVRYFPFDKIPKELSVGHLKRIEDAINRVGGGVAVLQELISSTGHQLSRKELFEIRDLSRQSRQQFYLDAIKQVKIRVETEVVQD